MKKINLKPFISGLKTRVSRLKPFISGLKLCISKLKASISESKPFISELKTFIFTLKAFVSELKLFISDAKTLVFDTHTLRSSARDPVLYFINEYFVVNQSTQCPFGDPAKKKSYKLFSRSVRMSERY